MKQKKPIKMVKFTCELCKEEFVDDTPEEEKLKEMRENFGDVAEEDKMSICDDCYNKIMNDNKDYLAELKKMSGDNWTYDDLKNNSKKLEVGNDVWIAREKPIDVTEHINSILDIDPAKIKDVRTTLKIDKVDLDKKIVYVSIANEGNK